MDDNLYSDIERSDGPGGFEMDRRHFLKVTGSGIFLFFTIGDTALFAQRQGRSLPSDFNAFLKIGEDGRVSCFTGKIEMGQGVVTSLAQMLSDELDVPLGKIDMVMGDTDLCPYDMGTFGSMSTRFFGPALQRAGAEARAVLIELAADHLKIAGKDLTAAEGAIVERSGSGRRVSYGELARGKRIERHLSGAAILKKVSEFREIGHPELRRDAGEKVTGRARYAGDIRLPGMLYGKILRPPAHGAKLIEADLSEAKKVTDSLVIRKDDFIAVLHKYPDVAEAALAKIKAKFEKPAPGTNDETIFDHLVGVAPEGQVVSKTGDLKEGERSSGKVVEGKYLNDYVAHAPIEPHTAVVAIEGERATVWASSQAPFSVREEVAKELGLQAANVHVISPFVGGGFGGKTRNLQAVEAARLAKLSGKPVQVAWTRKEEFFYDSFRPAAVVMIRSGFSGAGKINFWDYNVYFAGERGAQHFYDIPNSSTASHGSGWSGNAVSHPFATGPWRAPGNNTNTFARESQIDIMAAAAGVDPFEFRMRNLADKKMQQVLKAAADKFGWEKAKTPSGRGLGIACGIDAGTYVATIAEVEVDRATGGVKVKRVVAAQDMGLAVNPEGAALQMEGCVTMGLGYALKERIRFKDGEIFDENFDTYELPRFSWVPAIETVVLDRREDAPQGGGEPVIITMGGAVANAIFDAVGARLFRLPMTPERILEALKKG